MTEYKVEPLRGPSLILATAIGAVVLSLLVWARFASEGARWVFLIDVLIGTIAIVLPIFLAVGMWRRGYVSLAHRLTREADSVAFVSGRTPPLVDALRAINGYVGSVPGLFVVSVTKEHVQLLAPRSPTQFQILSLPVARIENVVAGRISEGTRMTNGIIFDLSGGPEGLKLPLIATGSGLGGVLQLPGGAVDDLRAAIQAQISERD